LAVVRFSGDGLDDVLQTLLRPMRPGPWRSGRTRRVTVVDGDEIVDDGLVVVTRAPHTYTGEDTAELSCHGNPLVVERILHLAVAAGARMAGPGAFTRRAVEHGKLDLVRAEGVLQLAEARSLDGLKVARSAVDGVLGDALTGLRGRLLDVAAELEARLDYPDDELAFVDDDTLVATVCAVADEAEALASTWRAGRVWVHGARVALVGAVNAGKSSLFNALLGRSRALVHDSPGTTRDVLEVATHLDGVPVTLLDTAGERTTDDPVEAAGLALARELVDEADLLVVVIRARPEGPSPTEQQILARTAGRARVVVCNGVDAADAPLAAVETVATTGQGIDALRQAIRGSLVGETVGGAGLVVASARQRDLLLEVARACREMVEALPVAGVAVAADAVVRALEELDSLTGADSRESVLDVLFARFCIGK
jgi:tRNA modification GTPase